MYEGALMHVRVSGVCGGTTDETRQTQTNIYSQGKKMASVVVEIKAAAIGQCPLSRVCKKRRKMERPGYTADRTSVTFPFRYALTKYIYIKKIPSKQLNK